MGKKQKALYCTSEYIDKLKRIRGTSTYLLNGTEFMLFSSKKAADSDAEWVVDFWRKAGKKIKKPTIYRLKLEEVA